MEIILFILILIIWLLEIKSIKFNNKNTIKPGLLLLLSFIFTNFPVYAKIINVIFMLLWLFFISYSNKLKLVYLNNKFEKYIYTIKEKLMSFSFSKYFYEFINKYKQFSYYIFPIFLYFLSQTSILLKNNFNDASLALFFGSILNFFSLLALSCFIYIILWLLKVIFLKIKTRNEVKLVDINLILFPFLILPYLSLIFY